MAGWVPLRCAIRRNTDANEAVSMSLLELDSTRNFKCQLRSYTGGLTNDLAFFVAVYSPISLTPIHNPPQRPDFAVRALPSWRPSGQEGRMAGIFFDSNRIALVSHPDHHRDLQRPSFPYATRHARPPAASDYGVLSD